MEPSRRVPPRPVDPAHPAPSTLTNVQVPPCRSARVSGSRRSYVRGHANPLSLHLPAPVGRGAARRGRGGGRRALPRRAGRPRPRRGQIRSLGIRVPRADRSGGRCPGGPSGGGERGHRGRPRAAAGRPGVDGAAPPGRAPHRRDRSGRPRHRGRPHAQRGPETGGGRGAALPCGARSRCHRPLPRAGGLVVPQQPRHPGRRPRDRHSRTAAALGRPGPADGSGGGAPARPGRGALSARRTRRGDPGRVRRGGRAARAGAARRTRHIAMARTAG